MDKLINVRVRGSYMELDSRMAGAQHEANATTMRMEFDPSWDGLAKSVTFWDAKGRNPTKVDLTINLLAEITVSTRVYLVPIPGEAMAESGEMTFAIDGYVAGKRLRSFNGWMEVEESSFAPDAEDAVDPTPTQYEQLQGEIEALMEDIQTAVQAAETADAAVTTANQAATTAQNAVTTANQAVQSASEALEAAENALNELENSGHASQAEVQAVQSNLNSHTGNTGNPHGVTAAQTGASPAGHNHAYEVINPVAVELTTGEGSGHGGYIDFHFDGSTADHTSRIIEEAHGAIRMDASNGVKVGPSTVAGLRVRNISVGTTELTEGAAATGYSEGDIHIVV